MNLITKTTLLLAATVSTALVVVCGLLLHYQEKALRDTILGGVDAQAKLAARGIGSFLVENLREARSIARTFPLEALRQGKLGAVESHLASMAEAFPGFENGVFVLDGAGTFLLDHPSHPELRGQSFAFREYYQRTIQEGTGVVGTPYMSKRSGMPVLTVTAPVRDERGAIAAIVACSLDLLSQEALGGYHTQRFGKTGYLYVFDRSRLLLLHPDQERLLTAVEAGKNRVLEAALVGFEGAGETVNSKGVPMVVAVRRIPSTGWIVAVQVTQEEAYAPVAAARARIALVAGFSILFAIALGFIAVRSVSRPLLRLESLASQLRGHLEDTERTGLYDLPRSVFRELEAMQTPDEVGSVAASFLGLATRLQSTLDALTRLSRIDGLTGLANRRRFDEVLQAEWRRSLREKQPLSLLMADVDFFKPYNDTYGHQAGDRCLTGVAQAIGRMLKRPSDLAARYGGEEFAVILPGTHPDGARHVAELVRQEVERLDLPHSASPVDDHVTISVGVSSLVPSDTVSQEELIRRTDAALYRAKDEGRNRSIVHDDGREPMEPPPSGGPA